MTQPVTDDVLVATRRSLHQVAEHVLSAARKRETGDEFALAPGPGGFRTPPLPDGRVLAVVGTDIAVIDDHDVRRLPLTTVRAAAELVGTEPGYPGDGSPATPFTPDDPLSVDAAAATVLADWFELGDVALRELAAELSPDDLPAPVLYPEHFDLAIVVAAVNYGASPGDDTIAEPYVYVGPFEGPPAQDGTFWNAPFGAYRTHVDVRTADDALAFFREGQRRIGRP
jgi:hypothetical protein